MIPRKVLLVIIIMLFGFIYILATSMESEGASGEIVVYDDEGNVEHVEKFTYVPDKRPYIPPRKVITNRTVEPVKRPPAPTAMKLVTEEEVKEDDDDNSRRQKRRKIKKIEYTKENGQLTTIVTRHERTPSGKEYITKEKIVDNRIQTKGAVNRKRANDTAPRTYRKKTWRRIR